MVFTGAATTSSVKPTATPYWRGGSKTAFAVASRRDDRQFARFRDAIAALPPGELTRGHLLNGRFALASGTGFAVHYAPFDHVNAQARVVLVGLTPGWQQTRLAFETARDRLRAGDSDDRVLWAVKQRASFAGMRKRLAQWLDGIDVDRALGLASTAELFDHRAELLQTTSAVRYPVFCSGDKNWSGTNPPITEPALRDLVRGVLQPELRSLPDALVVPLGVAVQTGLRDLVDRGELGPDRCLFGFPHPSGANASGPRRYADAQPRLKALVARWAGLPASRGEAPQSQRRAAATAVTPRVATAELPATEDAQLPDRTTLQRLMLDALTALGGSAQRQAIKRKAVELGPLHASAAGHPRATEQARAIPEPAWLPARLGPQRAAPPAARAAHRPRRMGAGLTPSASALAPGDFGDAYFRGPIECGVRYREDRCAELSTPRRFLGESEGDARAAEPATYVGVGHAVGAVP